MAQMTFRVCDPVTLEPLAMDQIMVGTKATLVVASDANSVWSGGVFLRGEDRLRGSLSARGKDSNSRDWIQSHLSQAGLTAKVTQWKDSYIWGFDLYTDDLAPRPGSWFVLDYTALEPGPCTIEFYDYKDSFTQCDPNLSFELFNSPSRDFNGDQQVNLADFMAFAKYWGCKGNAPPPACADADFDMDGSVGLTDLLAFSDYWLWGTPNWQPAPDPKIIYHLGDAGGNSTLTMTVGQTATIYIYKTTMDKEVKMIHLEAAPSDASLGWIDNSPRNPADPDGGTARILAAPRNTFFDDWGPGMDWLDGIYFTIVNLNAPLPDGAAASFQYTATAPGRATLRLLNHTSDYADMRPMEITQVAAP